MQPPARGEEQTGPEFCGSFFVTPLHLFEYLNRNNSMQGYFLPLYKTKYRLLYRVLPIFLLSVPTGRLLSVIQFCTVTRVSHHELLNQYFVVIHNFLSIIHANVCVVYLIVLLTIKSNFLKVLKDTKFNQRNYFSDAMLLSILNLLNSSLIYVPFWRKYEFNQTIRLKS